MRGELELSYFLVNESRDLSGSVTIQGTKNLILPLMAVALLVDGETIYDNCPDILDVRYTIKILEEMGCRLTFNDSTLSINTMNFDLHNISSEYSEKMRSSFLFLGPLLSRCKTAKISMPGGCKIGKRPVDMHLDAFKKLGVVIKESEYIYADARNLRDAYIRFDFPSVGATENVILLAVKSNVKVVLDNVAREPEIKEMCSILNRMGADIRWKADDRIEIVGVNKLHPIRTSIIGDRICAGTYIAAVGMCGGDVILKGINMDNLKGMSDILGKMGIIINEIESDAIRVRCNMRTENVRTVSTEPFPGFPTDMQSQLMALACKSRGSMEINENIFENRFRIVPELHKMQADITVKSNKAFINGTDKLIGARVNANDLRGGAALIIAGLGAKGSTIIDGIEYVNRGYENIVRDISILGGKISIIEG